jgi:hypothetical protein
VYNCLALEASSLSACVRVVLKGEYGADTFLLMQTPSLRYNAVWGSFGEMTAKV